MTRRIFPEGFLWGAATSSHQIEGGNDNNDWWRFEQAGRVVGGEVSGDAMDSYHRFAEDFDFAASMNHTATRLSLEWSRIEPREGEFDDAEVEHYAEVLRAARERGLRTFVTLDHFTVPIWFDDRGNWPRADAPEIFERYARYVAPRLGHLVDAWITLNEPMHYTNFAFYVGKWPPGKAGFWPARHAGMNQVRAHRRSYRALKELTPGVPAGLAVNSMQFKPCAPNWKDSYLGWWFSWFFNYWFLDKVRRDLDFIGVQYYMALSVTQLLSNAYGCEGEGPHTDMGWRISPSGFRDKVTETWRRYRLPIYITENGIADASDAMRPHYIRDHLAELHRSITEDGADVRGYFYWSLLDNFEWADGWRPKFGLAAVDRTTMERLPRPSSRYYAKVCADNGLDDDHALEEYRDPF
jgi:beta-glucosidase